MSEIAGIKLINKPKYGQYNQCMLKQTPAGRVSLNAESINCSCLVDQAEHGLRVLWAWAVKAAESKYIKNFSTSEKVRIKLVYKP